jgi:excinuclease ABC subunit A
VPIGLLIWAEGGENGGKLCYGTPEEIVKIKESVTGKYLKEKLQLI